MTHKPNRIIEELREHIPFTFLATLVAIILVFLLKFTFTNNIAVESFEIFHPAHIFVSAITSTAIFYKYKKKLFASIIIGLSASILLGTLSDVIIPFLGGSLLFLQTSLFLPVIENPLLIFGSALIGCLIGIIFNKTKLSHFIHVFLSTFASLFYLISFSVEINLFSIITSTLITFVAVLIPCCMSDIIYPLMFFKNKSTNCHE